MDFHEKTKRSLPKTFEIFGSEMPLGFIILAGPLPKWWIGKVHVASYELLLFCELRVNNEKCELAHSKCELRVPSINFKFPSSVSCS